eukprot:CAMPEP_0172929716 /NCGR_PEP_ID=MMETSP1075-20121228/218625_1 /TAXON_ID=2916 /ORGANISM="Ceratium fusus, Strain PA161109" /LENGTH=209 /DNA_ID=CAMNT_0013791017 /DNA_START=95 /DNA_END=720 /DNA_ORIENTATION=-
MKRNLKLWSRVCHGARTGNTWSEQVGLFPTLREHHPRFFGFPKVATATSSGQPRKNSGHSSRILLLAADLADELRRCLDFPKLPQQQAPGSLARIPATPQGSLLLAADLADELRRCAVALAKLFHLIGVIKAFATDLPPENCFGSNLLFHFLFLQDAIGDVKEPKHHCHSSRNDESLDLVRIVPYRTSKTSEDEAEQQAYHQDKFFPVS